MLPSMIRHFFSLLTIGSSLLPAFKSDRLDQIIHHRTNRIVIAHIIRSASGVHGKYIIGIGDRLRRCTGYITIHQRTGAHIHSRHSFGICPLGHIVYIGYQAPRLGLTLLHTLYKRRFIKAQSSIFIHCNSHLLQGLVGTKAGCHITQLSAHSCSSAIIIIEKL